LETRRGLALSYEKDGRFGRAIALLEDTLEVQTRNLGETHPQTKYTVAALEEVRKGKNGVTSSLISTTANV
jgi:hypothetical protein